MYLLLQVSCTKPKEIPITLHNGSSYEFHLVIKHLSKKGANTGKCIHFSVELKKTVVEINIKKEQFIEDLVLY